MKINKEEKIETYGEHIRKGGTLREYLAKGGKVTNCPTYIPQSLKQKWGRTKRSKSIKGKMK